MTLPLPLHRSLDTMPSATKTQGTMPRSSNEGCILQAVQAGEEPHPSALAGR